MASRSSTVPLRSLFLTTRSVVTTPSPEETSMKLKEPDSGPDVRLSEWFLCLTTFIKAGSALRFRQKLDRTQVICPYRGQAISYPSPRQHHPNARLQEDCSLSITFHRPADKAAQKHGFQHKKPCFLQAIWPLGWREMRVSIWHLRSHLTEKRNPGTGFPSAPTTPQGWDIHFQSRARWQVINCVQSHHPLFIYHDSLWLLRG